MCSLTFRVGPSRFVWCSASSQVFADNHPIHVILCLFLSFPPADEPSTVGQGTNPFSVTFADAAVCIRKMLEVDLVRALTSRIHSDHAEQWNIRPPRTAQQTAALCCDVLCCAWVGMVAGHAPKQVRDVLLHQRSASRPLRQPEDEGPTGKPRLQSSPVDRYCTTLYACVQPACSDWIYWICYLRL